MTPDGLPPHEDSLFHPTPRRFQQAPTVKELQFFFLMSPDYGETAAIETPNNHSIIVYRVGKLEGVTPSLHPGTYCVYMPRNEFTDKRYLDENEANAYIEALWSQNAKPE